MKPTCINCWRINRDLPCAHVKIVTLANGSLVSVQCAYCNVNILLTKEQIDALPKIP